MRINLIKYFHDKFYSDLTYKKVEQAFTNPEVINKAVTHIHKTHYNDLPKEKIMQKFAPLLSAGRDDQENFLNPPLPSQNPKQITIKDTRKIDATSGVQITDKNNLSLNVDSEVVSKIVKAAKAAGIDPYTALAMAHQESNYDPENPFHIDFTQYRGIPEEDVLSNSMDILNDKFRIAKGRGKVDEASILQAWNGYGKVGKLTEQAEDAVPINAWYGIDVSKTPIDMNKNPVYGKRIIDIRENIIKKNPDILRLINSTQ